MVCPFDQCLFWNNTPPSAWAVFLFWVALLAHIFPINLVVKSIGNDESSLLISLLANFISLSQLVTGWNLLEGVRRKLPCGLRTGTDVNDAKS